MLAVMLAGIVAIADYNPSNPPEPSVPPVTYRLTLTASPASGGSVGGASTALTEGARQRVSASPGSGYTFTGWYDENGELVSSGSSFYYTMPARDVSLTARFTYSPSNPSEPSQPVVTAKAQLSVSVKPSGAGSASGTGRYDVGTTQYVRAYNNSGFRFSHWELNGERYSTSSSFYYTVAEGENRLVAVFDYDPSNPAEPVAPVSGHRLDFRVSPSGAGSISPASGSKYAAGAGVYLQASAYSNYIFENWTDAEGNIVSTSQRFTYTMPDAPSTLTANYRYSPSSPVDPGEATPTRNVVYGERITAVRGETCFWGLSLDNIDAASGISADVTVPEGFSIDFHNGQLTERAPGHTLSVTEVSSDTYRIVVSGESQLAGHGGAIIRFPVTVPFNAERGTLVSIPVARGVVIRTEGTQIPAGAVGGLLKVSEEAGAIPDSPDFKVTDVSAERCSAEPGNAIEVTWKVINDGVLEATGGWSETIFLVDDAGHRATLGTVYYDTESLAVGETVARQATLAIPALPGVDGELDIQVSLSPYASSGEATALQGNNSSATTDRPVTLARILTVTLPGEADEATDKAVRGMLSRSGDRSAAQTFTLTCSPSDSRLVPPATVVIPRNQTSAYFTIGINADGKLSDTDIYTIEASGNGYTPTVASITLTDDTEPQLTLESESEEVTEGESFEIRVSIPRALPADLPVGLTCDAPSRFSFTPDLVIPAGETELKITVEAKDNDTPETYADVTFRAVAAGHLPALWEMTLLDNDIPSLEMEFIPASVSENVGPVAVTLHLRRTDNIDKKVTVILTDDADGALRFATRTVEFKPGVEDAYVQCGPVDNQLVDGDRTYNVQAAVYLASCSCSVGAGAEAGIVTAPLEVFDDDGPVLTLTSASTAINEGSKMTVTLSRNTSTAKSLTVTLESDSPTSLAVPATVVIPAGSASVQFSIEAPSNSGTGDGATVSVTASSEGFSKASLWLTVTDRTLPDATVGSIGLGKSESVAGAEVPVTLTVGNSGMAPLPEHTRVQLFAEGSAAAIGTLYTPSELQPGESVGLTDTFAAPASVGRHSIYAVVNKDREVAELSYSNNTSATVTLGVVSPYQTETKSDKTVYREGETVRFTGRAAGAYTPGETLELYIICDGYRRAYDVVIGEDGSYSHEFTPIAGESGHYEYGARFKGDSEAAVQGSFDIPALRRAGNDNIISRVTVGETFHGTFEIRNTSGVTVSGVSAAFGELPEGVSARVTIPAEIPGGTRATVEYTIDCREATVGTDWQELPVTITGEGVETLVPIVYYYAYTPLGQLVSDTKTINTTIVKGEPRQYPIEIRNQGRGATGEITLSLPSWMQSVTPLRIGSLEYGESATVVLLLQTSDAMSLNVPVRGQLAINCANGEGLAIPYIVEPVSTSEGVLTIDVCDEYTYYTDEAPHVAGAEVKVKHPTTGTLMAIGVTNADGLYSVTLPEGYYAIEVHADRHDSYTNNVIVDPERETTVRVDLSYQAITVDWQVVETEIEDEYTIVTTVDYETNVPVPVVVIDGPDSIDGNAMRDGESVIVNYTLTNHGLITAFETEFHTGEDSDEWSFEILNDPGRFDLGAGQSVLIPVRITRHLPDSVSRVRRAVTIGNTMFQSFDGCMTHMRKTYKTICGKTWKDNEGARALALKACMGASMMAGVYDALSWLGNFGHGLGGGRGDFPPPVPSPTRPYKPSEDTHKPSINQGGICDPAIASCGNDLVDGLMGQYSGVGGAVAGAVGAAGNAGAAAGGGGGDGDGDGDGDGGATRRLGARAMGGAAWDACGGAAINAAAAAAGRPGAGDAFNNASAAINGAGTIAKCYKAYYGERARAMRKAAPSYTDKSWVETYLNVLEKWAEELQCLLDMANACYGDAAWGNADVKQLQQLSTALAEADTPFSAEALQPWKPKDISQTQFEKYLERLNNTNDGVTTGNVVDVEAVERACATITALEEEAVANGYHYLADWYEAEYRQYAEALAEMGGQSSVCSTITLQFKQLMVMTRQAFRGTLSVYNGHDLLPMTDVRLNLEVTDADGNLATSHEMQINVEDLSGFSGAQSLPGDWTLGPDATGVATILFIPTRYAAPTVDTPYSFGGTISYIDPFSGLEVTRTLSPVTLTVKPSPTLDMTYFMQRDVYGDDPLTEEIEPSRDAEFALLVNNVGYGDATNVRITTGQPEIVDNEKGLLIDFELLGSTLNGTDSHLALGGSVADDFGDIPAHSQAVAQWRFRSTLLGHFTSYKVEANHVTSYGNEDLTLLGEVSVHELLRSLENPEVAEAGKNIAFLVNDLPDAEDLPDAVYLADGTTAEAHICKSATCRQTAENVWQLDISGSEGWNYGNVADPTSGRGVLAAVTRLSDGRGISLRNFWQTDRTLRDGRDPIRENLLHFADLLGSGTESYRLEFEPRPDVELSVVEISGIPAEGEYATAPVESVTVRFNKAVEASSFTAEDLRLTVQGKEKSLDEVTIEPMAADTFTVRLDGIGSENGLYVLTVQTAGITDSEGYTGAVGKSASWMMFIDGAPRIETLVEPAEAGAVERNTETPVYGDQLVVTAIPAEGYEFAGWKENGEDVDSDGAEYQFAVVADRTLVACFRPQPCMVTFEDAPAGVTIDGVSGFRDYGTWIELDAEVDGDYQFDGWLINGEPAGDATHLSHRVTGATVIAATAHREIFEHKIGMTRGWNWISSYLREAPEVSVSLDGVEELLTENGVEPGDAAEGRAYKVKTSRAVLLEHRGHMYSEDEARIELATGWNWIAMPRPEAGELSAVISNPAEGDVIASLTGFAEYADGRWEGTLNHLVPGEGYLYRSGATRELGFNPSEEDGTDFPEYDLPEEIEAGAFHATMNIIATVRVVGDARSSQGSEMQLYALCGSELRGYGISEGFEGRYYLTVHGEAGETVTFVAEEPVTGFRHKAELTLPFAEELAGSRREPLEIEINPVLQGIESMWDAPIRVTVCTTDGVMLHIDADASVLKTLPAGIYIINGNRYLIR